MYTVKQRNDQSIEKQLIPGKSKSCEETVSMDTTWLNYKQSQ